MKNILKRNIFVFVLCLLCFLGGLTFVTYAGTYNSEEIIYDTSTSGAVQANVKDALDFLYNKTKSGASAECPENMSCVEKPGVTLSVSGPGTVDKGTVYVGINETNTFTLTPNEGYVLGSINCDNGYTLGSFKTYDNSTQAESEISQTITINNPGTTSGATCTITFKSKEISVSSIRLNSTYKGDNCNSNGSGCICYQITNKVSNFTYGSHTGCNFKSTSCKHSTYNGGSSFNCVFLFWNNTYSVWHETGGGTSLAATCSGIITCAT